MLFGGEPVKLRCFPMIAAGLVLSGCARAAPFEEDDLAQALIETSASARFSEWLPDAEIQAVLRSEPLCRTGLSAVTQHREPDGTVRAEFSYAMLTETLTAQKSALAEYAAEWAESVSGYTPAQRVLLAHTRLCAVCDYTETGENIHSAYGALFAGQAVCDGYAEAFLLLCKCAEIPCIFVTGTAAGQAHAWNLVQLGGQWYHVDCAWDDLRQEHGYFLRDDAFMQRDHAWDRSAFPAANGDRFSYQSIAESMCRAPNAENCIE